MADDRSLTSLLTDLLREMTDLVRKEITLAKTEISENASKLGTGLIELAAGALLAFAGLLVLLNALVLKLAQYMDAALAALLVGGAVALIGVVLLLKGKSNLDPANLALTRTAESLQRDAELVKEQIRG